MLIRAGASNREMVGALGINIKLLFTLVFGLGAVLAGFAGMIITPITQAESGMGEGMLILAFVVIVIGGIYSCHSDGVDRYNGSVFYRRCPFIFYGLGRCGNSGACDFFHAYLYSNGSHTSHQTERSVPA